MKLFNINNNINLKSKFYFEYFTDGYYIEYVWSKNKNVSHNLWSLNVSCNAYILWTGQGIGILTIFMWWAIFLNIHTEVYQKSAIAFSLILWHCHDAGYIILLLAVFLLKQKINSAVHLVKIKKFTTFWNSENLHNLEC